MLIGFAITALVLYAILCPCVSYIIIRRWLIPWSGGVFLLTEDEELIPVDWITYNWTLPYETRIRAIFLSGADLNMMPSVEISPISRFGDSDWKKDRATYPEQFNNGVYIWFSSPPNGEKHQSFYLDVSTPYPWKNGEKYKKGYGNRAYIYFKDKPSETPASEAT